jgi:hypothetical protein
MAYDQYSVRVYALTERDANGLLLNHDTLGLFSSHNIMAHSGGQYMEQWQFLKRAGTYFDVDANRLNPSSQGTGVSDTALFMHPPRFSYLTVLQFCPYPFFRNMSREGNTWDWELAIGGAWAIDSLYPLNEGPELFKTHYVYSGRKSFETYRGTRQCYKVEAVTTSRFGTATATFLLADTSGLVHYEARTTNGLGFEMHMIAKGSDTEIMGANNSFIKYWHPPAQFNVIPKGGL